MKQFFIVLQEDGDKWISTDESFTRECDPEDMQHVAIKALAEVLENGVNTRFYNHWKIIAYADEPGFAPVEVTCETEGFDEAVEEQKQSLRDYAAAYNARVRRE